MQPFRHPLARRGTHLIAILAILIAAALQPIQPVFAAGDYIVSKTADTNDGTCDADCSLREAITAANADGINSTITFASGANGTITLGSALPELANNGTLTITGNGAANTIVSGNNAVRGLLVSPNANVTLNSLTVTGGNVVNNFGGGIRNEGTLTVNNSTISGNTATFGGGAIFSNSGRTLTVNNSIISSNSSSSGGGIRANSPLTLTVTNSTISGNSASNEGGGIMILATDIGTVTVTNSIISNNSASNDGGGFHGLAFELLTVRVTNSTFSGNSATNDGGGIYWEASSNDLRATLANSTFSGNSATSGGGIYNFGRDSTVNMRNTIVANSTSGGDCVNAPTSTLSAQNSLIEDGLTCVNGTNTNNRTGDPALAANLALTSTSIAINAGNNIHIPGGVTTDLAGNARIFGGTVDMGAYELAYTPNFIVDTVSDANLQGCTSAANDCSLRGAITFANSLATDDTITFAISSGLQTISPASALPTITDTVTIDGTTQPGYAGTPIIELNGTNAGASVNGLSFDAGSNGSTVRGLVINRFTNRGISVFSANSITIAGNYIGTNAAGTADLGNGTTGLYLDTSSGSTVGGTGTNDRNVISGNGTEGIFVAFGGSHIIEGNYIGTNAAGDASIGNNNNGMAIGASANNRVGGTTAAARNLISGNALGVQIFSNAHSNTVQGNYIGTNATGTAALPNTSEGVFITVDSDNNTIGGTAAGAGNLISGNTFNGVLIAGSGVDNNLVQGNWVGTGSGGGGSIPNGTSGIFIHSGPAGNTVGGNVIRNNGTGGVVIALATALISANEISDNTGLGIDLTLVYPPDGVTANDPGDGDTGSNDLQNFPALTDAILDAGAVTVTGTFNSTASTAFTVEFFANAACDASGHGEGETFLGSTTVSTDGTGNATISYNAGSLALGTVITATATHTTNNTTSEFSNCVTVTPLTPIVTISATDANAAEGAADNGTFRITRAGSTSGDLMVVFNKSGTATDTLDYLLGMSATIPDGQAFVDVTLTAIDDLPAEADETVILTLQADEAYIIAAAPDDTATVTIAQNDLVVTNTNDSGEGSLRQAIINANVFATNDTITFTAGANGTITLMSALPDLANNGTLTITGNGAANTIISGNNAVRGFYVFTNANVTLNSLTVTQGNAGSDFGGGIRNEGTLTVNNSTISNNDTSGNGGGIFSNRGKTLTITNSLISGNFAESGSGGGVFSSFDTTMTVVNSIISGNSVTGGGSFGTGRGGGILAFGALTVTNSTISGNSATINGGGIISGDSTITLTNSTLSGNSATSGGGIFIEGSSTVLNLRNSILANGVSGGDCVRGGGTINAQNSLIEDGLTCVNGTNTNNLTGDPALNGDLTLTSTSIAINAGNNSLIPGGVTTDLAGNARIQQGIVDMGAYESPFTPFVPTVNVTATGSAPEGDPTGITFTFARSGAAANWTNPLTVTIGVAGGVGMVNADFNFAGASITGKLGLRTIVIPAGQGSVDLIFTAVDDVDAEADNLLLIELQSSVNYTIGANNGVSVIIPQNDLVVTNTNDSGDGSLRQAIINANVFATNDTITFTAGANGTITLESLLDFIADNGTLTITGNGAANTIISGNDQFAVLVVSVGATVDISGLTVTNGYDIDLGGGIYTYPDSVVEISSSVIKDSSAGSSAGGISNGGTMHVINSIITGNTSPDGAGIVNGGSLTLINVLVSGNSATRFSGGIYSAPPGSTTTLINTTVTGNSAGMGGGNLNVVMSTLTLQNSIVANASAGGDCLRDNLSTINAVNSLIEGGLGCVNGTNSNNLTGDPALNSDLSLTYQSIAINAGNNALVPAGVTTDFAGNPRIQGSAVDIGAYESDATGALTVQLTMQGRPAAPNAAWIASAQVQIRPQGGGSPILSATYASDSSGRFTIPALPEGAYTLWVKGTHTLARAQSLTIAAGNNNATTAALPEGDANNDNVITISDFSLLAAAFGKATGQVGFDARADFNQDGVVTVADFSLLAANFGQAGTS